MLAVTEETVTEEAGADKSGKKRYVDNGWPFADGEHAVSEFATNISGALSPFGDVEFPLPQDELPFVQAKTVINR
ncbi:MULTISPECIES: hypothetical protein [unclassified Gordonia (in: high G+C Gram-positive bacteria)]|uniref:hypothetical protein n=1 Tax=unclassified Gordonia (in: high G+C Gram-positive bacteria) TaxID=2657482 RepID=UPI001F0D68E8|nr:hypothetical protein [Gordonia sp. ABSL49_1]MCH5643207.1 hypothetical protein [Gordonia sp. ABSL49_1]